MINKIFALYDNVVGAYLNPFPQSTLGSAERACVDLLSDKQNNVAAHAADYHLYYLADFDNETGVHTNVTPPQLVRKLGELTVR